MIQLYNWREGIIDCVIGAVYGKYRFQEYDLYSVYSNHPIWFMKANQKEYEYTSLNYLGLVNQPEMHAMYPIYSLHLNWVLL